MEVGRVLGARCVQPRSNRGARTLRRSRSLGGVVLEQLSECGGSDFTLHSDWWQRSGLLRWKGWLVVIS